MNKSIRSKFSLLSGCLLAVAMAASARADVVFSIGPTPIFPQQNSSGDFFDVLITNTGPSITVGTFSFEISISEPTITLTDADFATVAAPYIFAGQSLDQDIPIPLVVSNDGQTLSGSDSSDSTGAVVGTGVTLSLGRVLFDVGNTPFGAYPITFTNSGFNSLSDPNGNNIPIDTLSDGLIIVSPEPGTVVLMFGGLALLYAFRRFRG